MHTINDRFLAEEIEEFKQVHVTLRLKIHMLSSDNRRTFCNNFNILKKYMIGQREWVWFKPERSSNTSSVWRVILLTWRQNLGYVFTNSDPFSLWNVVIMTLYTQSDKVSKSLTQLSSLLLRGVYKEWDVIMVVNAF